MKQQPMKPTQSGSRSLLRTAEIEISSCAASQARLPTPEQSANKGFRHMRRGDAHARAIVIGFLRRTADPGELVS